ncbi:MAG TPA: hypothetical protein VIJ53_05900 [Acidobacteriaceae bacterium]|jgi:hypothetical protein
MKPITVITFLTLATTLALGSASAQMQPRQVRATVPFDFTVGNKQLPAGTYSIARAKDGSIQILNRKGIPVVMTLASESGSPSKGCALNFDRRDGQYFMRAVQCESAAISINLPVSNLEKRIPVEVGKLQESDGPVLIAAR